ncbi:hypothetical protein B0H19DRAFT_1258131 [Mycena capillaripes]|nr:hypothetical protein B0H19DRAFT_1258131 [Mycena capillaripes]
MVGWQALGPLADIEARKSKVLLLGLCRAPSNDPVTYYTLKDACVVPLAAVKRAFKNTSQRPSRILKDYEQERQMNGWIGAMLGISMEQAEDDSRPVSEALGKVRLSFTRRSRALQIQAHPFIADHRAGIQKLGQLPEEISKACLANALCGGLFTPTFRTS